MARAAGGLNFAEDRTCSTTRTIFISMLNRAVMTVKGLPDKKENLTATRPENATRAAYEAVDSAVSFRGPIPDRVVAKLKCLQQ